MFINLIFCIFFASFSFSNLGDNSYDASNPKMQEILQLIDQENFHSALEKLMVIYEDDKNNSNIQTLIGFTYRNLGDYDNSIEFYKKAIINDPVNINAHHYIALSYIGIGKKIWRQNILMSLYEFATPFHAKK